MRIALPLLVLATVFVSTAQVKRVTPAPKNLQLLKPSEVQAKMNEYRTGLDVPCGYCHMPGDYATDDNPNKGIARNMITLTRDINAKFPAGNERVTCYTCHRGAEMPLMDAAAAK